MVFSTRKLKLFGALVSVGILLILWRRSAKSNKTCKQLFANVHSHIAQDAFDYREESFVGLWASSNMNNAETCSYYTFKKRTQKMMLGYKTSGGKSSEQYIEYSKGEDGVISYFSVNDPTTVLGYIYPVFYDEDGPGLGNIECTDENGSAKWKATIGAPIQLFPQFKEDIIKKGLKAFKAIGPQLGVDIHIGNFYEKTCWNPPAWNKMTSKPKNGLDL